MQFWDFTRSCMPGVCCHIDGVSIGKSRPNVLPTAEYHPSNNARGQVVRYKFAFQWCEGQVK